MCGEACVEGVKWMSDSYQMGLVCLKSDRLALERLLAGYKGSAQLDKSIEEGRRKSFH
jgi:hypothetical protein